MVIKSAPITLNGYFLIRWFLLCVVLLCAGCASDTERKPVFSSSPAHPALVNYALSLQGAPYRYGKDSPEEGFDCSGFVRHVYKKQGVKLPRTAKAMASALPKVPDKAIHPGDLLFFNINNKPFSHVGIYVSGDQFIHAPSRRTGRVLVSSLRDRYWQRCYVGARRP